MVTLTNFGPIGDSERISVTASSQRFVLGTQAASNPALRLIALNPNQTAWYIKLGDNTVTVSPADGMRANPASQNAPLLVPILNSETHIAIMSDGGVGDVLLSTGGFDEGELAPNGASVPIAVTQTDQRVELPSLPAGTPALRFVSMQPSISCLWIKLGDVTVTGDTDTSMRVFPGSVENPTIVPVKDGETHLSIFCEGIGGTVVMTPGAILGFSGGGGGGAPDDAEYIVAAGHSGLTAERVATDTATIDWDFGTAAQAKAHVLEVPGIAATGLVVRTAAATYAARSIAVSGAGLSISNSDGVSGDPTLAIADDLAAIEALSGTGYATRTGAGTWAQRSMVAGTGIAVSNGAGIAGNTEIDLQHLGFETLVDPGADRLLFWDDSAGTLEWLTLGANLSITGTTLNAASAGGGITSVVRQVFTASGTYTPTPGMVYCIARLQAAGGGSGSADGANSIPLAHCSGGGGGGEYAEGVFDAATIGASQAVTIGAAGIAGSGNGGNGGNASASSLGALMTANGGSGGTGTGSNGVNGGYNAGGAGGTGGTGGSFRVPGGTGGFGWRALVNTEGPVGVAIAGTGGHSILGAAPGNRVHFIDSSSDQLAAVAGANYGVGATGAINASNSTIGGAAGGPAIMIITEYVA